MFFRKVIGLAVLAAIIVMLFGCSTGRGDISRVAKQDSVESSAAIVRQQADADRVLADLNEYEVPPDVDSELFERLAEKLLYDIERINSNRNTSQAEMEIPELNLVRVGNIDGTTTFFWRYFNVGDYDMSGEVGIADITPIAQNYLADTDDGVNDYFELFIDGDESGDIGISDITPIANNYLNTCNVEIGIFELPPDMNWTSTEWTDNAVVALSGGLVPSPEEEGGFYLHIDIEDEELYGQLEFTVDDSVFMDVTQNHLYFGVRDNAEPCLFGSYEMFSLGSGDVPPVIESVSPVGGDEGEEVIFQAKLTTGTTPLIYDWDFGGAATPDTSTDSAPRVILSSAGSYDASLTITNDFGSDTFNWVIDVAQPPEILSMDFTPASPGAYPGQDAIFTVEVRGTGPFTYNWDFGDGANPSSSDDESPTVALRNEGDYLAALTVTNDFGADTSELPFTVLPPGDVPDITDVAPTMGLTGEPITFVPTLTGFEPMMFFWNFDGGAIPDSSMDANPEVILGEPGTYDASVMASNIFGNHTYNWTLFVDTPIVIDEVTPLSGFQGFDATFSATFSGGTLPYSYEWDFGDAATPPVSNQASPTVQLGETPGNYDCLLTISDKATSTDFPFTFEVVMLDPSRYIVLTVTPEGPISAGETAVFTATTYNGDDLQVYDSFFDVYLDVNTPYGTFDQMPDDTSARMIEMTDNGDGTYTHSLYFDVAGDYCFSAWVDNTDTGTKEPGVFDEASLSVNPGDITKLLKSDHSYHKGVWFYGEDSLGNSWDVPSLSGITYSSSMPGITALEPVIEGKVLFGGFTATDYGTSVLTFELAGNPDKIFDQVGFCPIEMHVERDEGIGGKGVTGDSSFELIAEVKNPEDYGNPWSFASFDVSYPDTAPVTFVLGSSGSDDPNVNVTIEEMGFPGQEHILVSVDWIGAGSPPASVPVTLFFNTDAVTEQEFFDFTVSNTIYLEDAEGIEIDWSMSEFPDYFFIYPIVLKPVKTLDMHVYVVQGEATEAQVQADVQKTQDLFDKAAMNCSLEFFIVFNLQITTISTSDWNDDIDTDGDGLDRYDRNGDGDYADDGDNNDLFNAMITDPPYYDSDPNTENIYYVPSIRGGALGTTYWPNGQVAIDNGLDSDNLTLAHEKVHELDLRKDGDFDVLDGADMDDSRAGIQEDPTARAQGAYRAGNIMNYNSTGDGLTADQGQHLDP